MLIAVEDSVETQTLEGAEDSVWVIALIGVEMSVKV